MQQRPSVDRRKKLSLIGIREEGGRVGDSRGPRMKDQWSTRHMSSPPWACWRDLGVLERLERVEDTSRFPFLQHALRHDKRAPCSGQGAPSSRREKKQLKARPKPLSCRHDKERPNQWRLVPLVDTPAGCSDTSRVIETRVIESYRNASYRKL